MMKTYKKIPDQILDINKVVQIFDLTQISSDTVPYLPTKGVYYLKQFTRKFVPFHRTLKSQGKIWIL